MVLVLYIAVTITIHVVVAFTVDAPPFSFQLVLLLEFHIHNVAVDVVDSVDDAVVVDSFVYHATFVHSFLCNRNSCTTTTKARTFRGRTFAVIFLFSFLLVEPF